MSTQEQTGRILLKGKNAEGETVFQEPEEYLVAPEITSPSGLMTFVVVSPRGFTFELYPKVICHANADRAVRCAEMLLDMTSRSTTVPPSDGWRLPFIEEAVTIVRMAEQITDACAAIGIPSPWSSPVLYIRRLMTCERFGDRAIVVYGHKSQGESRIEVSLQCAKTPGDVISVRSL